MLGMLAEQGRDPTEVFTGNRHDPAPLGPDEPPRRNAATPESDLPEWLVPVLRDALGQDFAAYSQAMRDRAPVWLRVSRGLATPDAAMAALAQDHIAAVPNDEMPHALRVIENARRLAQASAYTGGLVELQDLSPQRACDALPLADGDRVLDYCAGGGGKALALAARARVDVVAHDIEPARMRDLPARAARAGVQITLADKPAGRFDLVVADVPCSGSGTWRRTPDAKWRLTQSRLDDLTMLQGQIIREAAAFVARGGHLAYMTCSVIPAENEEIIQAFLHDRPDFILRAAHRFLPPRDGDGFYLAVLGHGPVND